MFHNIAVPEICLSLWQTCTSLVPELLKGCTAKTTDLLVKSTTPIDPRSGAVYLIKEGILNEVYDNQVAVIYEKGDLVGIDGVLQAKHSHYETEFAIKVDEYDGQQLLEQIINDKNKAPLLTQYLSLRQLPL